MRTLEKSRLSDIALLVGVISIVVLIYYWRRTGMGVSVDAYFLWVPATTLMSSLIIYLTIFLVERKSRDS